MCRSCDLIQSFQLTYPDGLKDFSQPFSIDYISTYFQHMDFTYKAVISMIQTQGPPVGSNNKNKLWRDSCWYPLFNSFKKKRYIDKKIINDHFSY